MEKSKIKKLLLTAGISPNQEIIIKQVRGEDSNAVFRLNCGGKTYALKIFSKSLEANQFYNNLLFNQIALTNNIPTPKIICSDDRRKLLPAPWILWEWVAGKDSCNLEAKTERLNSAIKMGKLLRKIHAIKVSGFGHANQKNKWSGKTIKATTAFFAKRLERLNKKAGSIFSSKELKNILNLTANSQELLSFNKPYLLHGDVTGGNVIVSTSKKITLIDPGEIIAGDPMADLGYSQHTGLSPIFRQGVWKGYTNKKPLTKEEFDRFLRWQLLRQCIITCRAFTNKNKNAKILLKNARSLLKNKKP